MINLIFGIITKIKMTYEKKIINLNEFVTNIIIILRWHSENKFMSLKG